MAIALDTSVDGGLVNPGTSITWAHTCSGINRILFVTAFGNIGTDVITGATYGGVAMSLVNKIQCPTDRWVYLFSLINPLTGANNVVVSASGSIAIAGQSASYTGVKQTGQPDANNTGTAVKPATSITVSVTTGANNDWTVFGGKNDVLGAMTAGTGSTVRQAANGLGLFDSNGAITPAGSYSMTVNTGATPADFGMVIASFAPDVGTTSNSTTHRNYISNSVSV